MIFLRTNDGSAPAQFFVPASPGPGIWAATPSCPTVDGVRVWHPSPVAQRDAVRYLAGPADFLAAPPPSLTSQRYRRDYIEVMTVGGVGSTERPQDRADVARFYAASSPSLLLNLAARQVSVDQGRELSHNARALALINMAINDSLVASFLTKYHYNYWRPETAIRLGDLDPDPTFLPFITTPG